jgi:hypothetical protein
MIINVIYYFYYYFILVYYNLSVAVSTSEQLPKDGQVWPKHVAV